jgi:hypothetical protein
MYESEKPILLKKFKKELKTLRKVLDEFFTSLQVSRIIEQTGEKYEQLIGEMPSMSKERVNFKSMYMSAWMLALFRALENEGMEFDKINEIAKNIFKTRVEAVPRIIKFLVRSFARLFFFSKPLRKKLQNEAIQTGNFTEPGDWKMEYVEGETPQEFGINYTKCGICKFYKDQNAEEYIPLMCYGDYVVFEAIGIHFKRTQTLAEGADHCDFRFLKD